MPNLKENGIQSNYEMMEWDILLWTVSHKLNYSAEYRRRVEDNLLLSVKHTMLLSYMYKLPLNFV